MSRRSPKQNNAFALIALSIVCALVRCTPALALDPSLDASQYAHASWKISEGFCKGAIHAMAQTPDGYLWLATEFGLLRFDGVRTMPWQPPPGEHLPSTDIRSLAAAADGTLWLGTAKGLVSWKVGRLTHYPQFDRHDVHTLLIDRGGTVWASGTIWEAGLSKTNTTILCGIDRGRAQCYGQDGSFGGFGVTSMYEDSRRNLWLGAANGLWRWKPGRPQHYSLPELKSNGVGGLIFLEKAFLEADDGTLLIAAGRGINQFVNGKLKPYPVSPSLQQLRGGELFRDRNGAIWIGTLDYGLFHLHRGRVDVFEQSDGLSTNWVENLFEDREGNIWIATRDGLDRFREYAVPSISVKQGLSSLFIRSALGSSDGSVWMATPNGLNRWKNGQVTIYRKAAKSSHPGPSAERTPSAEVIDRQSADVREVTANGLPDNDIGSLYQEEPDGKLWISTAQGIAYFTNGRFTPVPGVHIASWSFSPVARDSSGNFWMTSNQGLYRLAGGALLNICRRKNWGFTAYSQPFSSLIPYTADSGWLRGKAASCISKMGKSLSLLHRRPA